LVELNCICGTITSYVKRPMGNIRVVSQSWGEAQLADVEAVLDSVTHTFRVHADITSTDTILVAQSPEQFPRALSDPGPNGERIVLLSTSDRLWSQLAYQFSHEYCHVFTKHYLTPLEHSFSWFEESICEMDSIWCLSRMGADWALRPPYPHWASYGNSLHEYAMSRIDGVQIHKSPEEFKKWLESNLDEMTSNGNNRALNQIVAVRLYPMFQIEPFLWKSVEQLNQNPNFEGDFESYLQRWLQTVATQHRESVRRVSSNLGYELEQVT